MWFLAKCWTYFGKIQCSGAKFHRYKWPNIEKNSSHLVTLDLGFNLLWRSTMLYLKQVFWQYFITAKKENKLYTRRAFAVASQFRNHKSEVRIQSSTIFIAHCQSYWKDELNEEVGNGDLPNYKKLSIFENRLKVGKSVGVKTFWFNLKHGSLAPFARYRTNTRNPIWS